MIVKRSLFRASGALTLITAPLLIAGCSSDVGNEPTVGAAQQALSSNAGRVLGFESPGDWTVTSSPPIATSSNSTHTQGAASLAIKAKNYVTLRSAAISVSSALSGTVSFDLFLPPPSNPYWAGAAQLYVDCNSHGVYNQYLGQHELQGKPTGRFSTLNFAIPSGTASALANGCSDLRFTIALNVPFDSTGTYLLDNLQLGGPAAVTSCDVHPTSDSTGFTTNVTTTLVRPDLGTFTLDTTSIQGDPTLLRESYKLNGNPLYEIESQISANGALTRNETYFPPITGVQHVTTTSDGTTMVLVVDGRATVPAPVGTPAAQIRFVDGKPAPQLVAPPGIGDALQQLANDAARGASTCVGGLSEDVLALTNPRLPNGGVSGSQCTTCEVGCDGALLSCAVGAAVVCGPFAFVCGAVGAVACTAAFVACEGVCHRSGTDCCPVACGGEAGFTTPIGACCAHGNTCMTRANDDHSARCCAPNTTPCGGTQCCLAGDTCIPVQNGGFCCPPEDMKPDGKCCFQGACKTNADCGPNVCNSDGCCVVP